jgi:hypothetical protein
MIDWKIELDDKELYFEEGWFFSNFSIQEYLLPMINIGIKYIDEYNDTTFLVEDCKRLLGNLKYIENILKPRKEAISFDSLLNGIVQLQKTEIEKCVEYLIVASQKAIEMNGKLKFYGD